MAGSFDENDAKYLKRKVKFGNVDVHPTEKALVVTYEVEAVILGESGEPMLGDYKECHKLIKVGKSLTKSTNIRLLAQEIMTKCKLIHQSKQPEIEQLLYYLQNRKDGTSSKEQTGKRHGTIHETPQEPNPLEECEIDESANINDIEDYLELLYDDIPNQLRGSALILQLTRQPDNLEEIFQNEVLIQALARTLRDEWMNSTQLATNIVYIFFCFSSFTAFHPVIQHFKIGALCLTIVEKELAKLEQAGVASHGIQHPAMRKQEQLIRVALYLLLNIAEDLKTEMKMRQKQICPLLVKALSLRHNSELLILVVSFIKKLSVFVENKVDFQKANLIKALAPLVPCDHEDLLNITLRLLLNLSFDKQLRSEMVKFGMLPKLVELINDEKLRLLSLCILFHISMDDKHKAMFSYTDAIPLLMRIILVPNASSDQKNGKTTETASCITEAMALIINLSADKRCAALMVDGGGFKVLIKRTLKTKDFLMMKLLRNLSEHEGESRMRFVDFIAELAGEVTADGQTPDPLEDYRYEALGLLANLSVPDLDYQLVDEEFGTLAFIQKKLSAPVSC